MLCLQPSFLIYVSGCDCSNIRVKVENDDATIYQFNSIEGSYEVSERINGETTWVSSPNYGRSNAIWYSQSNDWIIGDLSNIGKNNGQKISSGKNGRFSCPYEANNTYDHEAKRKRQAPYDISNSITIQCTSPLQGDKKVF